MRIESSVTAVTWLPLAVLESMPNLPLGVAVAHHDEPPGERLGDLDELREQDRFREANELRAWVEIEDGAVVDFGRSGRGLAGGGGLDLGADQIAFPAIEFPVIQPEPEVDGDTVRFTQTVGGRLGLPVPRPVSGKPYFQIASATAWTTVELVLRADGSADGQLVSASPFPRHALYDANGELVDEQGATDYATWHLQSTGESPWGDETSLDAQLDRELDRVALRSGTRLPRRRLRIGETLVEQGEPGAEMYLLVDGALNVEVDGAVVAEVGPGALVGDLAILGDGRRTATLRAVRACRVALLADDAIAGSRLAQLVADRRAVQGL
jgi:hypothetical protein